MWEILSPGARWTDEVTKRKCYEHFRRLEVLLGISGLAGALHGRISADAAFRHNWETVLDWNEAGRYNPSRTASQAPEMIRAVTDPSSGVLTWLKTRY